MKLDKLRGTGPWFAFASPTFLALFIIFLMFAGAAAPRHPNLPVTTTFLVATVGALVCLALWAVTLLVVALDLEWIEHPLTHTPMTYVALAAAAIGTLAFLGLLVAALLNYNNTRVIGGLGILVSLGFGVYLVIINVVGRRAAVFSGVLAGVGITSGALFLAADGLVLAGLTPAVGLVLFPAMAAYMFWSVWLGFRLRGIAPATARV